MTCKDWEALLPAYLDQDLESGRRSALKAHLLACPHCRQMLGLLRDVKNSLQTIPEVEVSPELRRRLLSIPRPKRRFRINLDFLVRPALQPVLAAAALFLTLVSFYAFSPQRSTINKTVERQLHLGYHRISKLYTQAESLASTLLGYRDQLLVTLNEKNPLFDKEEL